jgi:glycerophosphoryl diester phosphodiesterase
MKLTATGVAIIAHRGASADAPENTLAAFELAIVQGAEWVEFDVRRSRDGVLFIHHDPNRRYEVLSKLSFAEIRLLPGAERVMTFEELLEALKGRVKLDIEIKERGFEAELVKTALKYFPPSSLLVTSFLDAVIVAIKAADPRIRTGLILGKRLNDQDPFAQFSDLFPRKRVQLTGADLVATHYLVGGVLVRYFLRRVGIPVAMWTINNPNLIKRYLRDPNVVAIITNRPALALELKAEAAIAKHRS